MIAICLLLATMQTAWAIDAEQLFKEFKEARNAEYVSIPRFLMKVGVMIADKSDESAETKRLMRSVHSMKVLDLEDCSSSVKQKFMERIDDLSADSYETLVRVNDEGDKVKILARAEKDVFKEILIVCGGTEDCTLVQFTGNFKESDINALMEQAENQR